MYLSDQLRCAGRNLATTSLHLQSFTYFIFWKKSDCLCLCICICLMNCILLCTIWPSPDTPRRYTLQKKLFPKILSGQGGVREDHGWWWGERLFSFLVRTLHVTAVSKEYEVCVGYSPSNPQTAAPTRKLPH